MNAGRPVGVNCQAQVGDEGAGWPQERHRVWQRFIWDIMRGGESEPDQQVRIKLVLEPYLVRLDPECPLEIIQRKLFHVNMDRTERRTNEGTVRVTEQTACNPKTEPHPCLPGCSVRCPSP